MKRLTFLFTCLLALNCSAQSPSATPPVQLPAGPILANLEFLQWQITTTEPLGSRPAQETFSAAPAPTPAPRVTSSHITKTGQVKRVETVNSLGEKTLKWSFGNSSILTSAGSARPILFADDANKIDFPELSWISPRNFAGVSKFQDQDCFIFRDRLSILSEAEINDAKNIAKQSGGIFNADSFKVDAWAAISVQARLPLAAKRGKEDSVYRYLPTPTTVQELPPDLRKLIEGENRRIQDLGRKPASS